MFTEKNNPYLIMLKILTFIVLLSISMLSPPQSMQILKRPINCVLQQLKRPATISIDTRQKKNRINEDAESFRFIDVTFRRYFD